MIIARLVRPVNSSLDIRFAAPIARRPRPAARRDKPTAVPPRPPSCTYAIQQCDGPLARDVKIVTLAVDQRLLRPNVAPALFLQFHQRDDA
jgi:hypothetical protein